MCFQSSFASAKGARIADGSRYIVPGSRCTRVGGSKRNCSELEVETLADRQPVQLPSQLSGNGTTSRLSDHTGRASEFWTRRRRSRLHLEVP